MKENPIIEHCFVNAEMDFIMDDYDREFLKKLDKIFNDFLYKNGGDTRRSGESLQNS